MYLAHFKKIPEWFKQMINEFEDSALNFWFWVLTMDESNNNIINFCAKKYVGEIKKDIFAFAKMIKIEIALMHEKINDIKLKRELREIKKIINIELNDMKIFFHKTVKTVGKEFAYEN